MAAFAHLGVECSEGGGLRALNVQRLQPSGRRRGENDRSIPIPTAAARRHGVRQYHGCATTEVSPLQLPTRKKAKLTAVRRPERELSSLRAEDFLPHERVQGANPEFRQACCGRHQRDQAAIGRERRAATKCEFGGGRRCDLKKNRPLLRCG